MNSFLRIAITLAIPTVFAACSAEKPAQHNAQVPAVPVQTTKVALQPIPAAEAYVGNITSDELVVIATKMMGRILALPVKEGDLVKKGQALVSIDVAEVQSAYDQSRAGLVAADVAFNNAERDYQRLLDLYQKNVITKQQLEQMEGGLAVARAHRAQAAANIKASSTLLSYGALTSPIDGVVTHRYMDPGNLAGPGAPILTVENPNRLEISVQVPEARAHLLRIGQRAQVAVSSIEKTISAEITALVVSSDPMTRTRQVKLRIPTESGILPGQFASVRFDAMAYSALAVPRNAIVEEGQMDGVYVVEDNRARLRWIQLGQQAGNIVQVIAGLHEGDRIVTPIPRTLHDDSLVKAEP